MSASFEAPNGTSTKLRFSATGSNSSASAFTPTPGALHLARDGTPLNTPREELAEVTEEDMQAYLELVSERLVEEYGFKRVYTNGHDDEPTPARWMSTSVLRDNALRRRRR